MNKKYILIGIVVIIVAGTGWYLLSPLWRTNTLDEVSPLAGMPQQDTVAPIDASSVELGTQINPHVLEGMDDATRTSYVEEMGALEQKPKMMQEEAPLRPKIQAQASFTPWAHEVVGEALLINTQDNHIIRFENFKTVNGPNLHIYLSADLEGNDFVDLGPIRATEGNINYTVPQGVDVGKYNKVLVWCVPFKVLFSFAELSA